MLACLWPFGSALADGGFFGKGFSRRVESRPEIPWQRAVLSYRNGEETLLIESTMAASRGTYFWLIPVPSEPVEMHAGGRGSLETVSQVLAPRLESGEPMTAAAIFLWLLIVWAVALKFAGQAVEFRRFERREFFLWMFVLHTICCLPAMLLFPVFAQAKGGIGENEAFRHAGTLGSYEAYLLRATEPDRARAWLLDHGLALNEREREAFDGYMAKGWGFVFAELRSDTTGTMSPHPILLKFRTKQPVYPMRLTATGHGRLRLDLYVVGEKQARVPGFQARRCRQVIKHEPYAFEDASYEEQALQFRPVSHPDVVPMLWDGAWLTHLRRESDATDFSDDLYLRWQEPSEFMVQPYTPSGAWARGALIGMGLVWATVIIGTWLMLGFRVSDGRKWTRLWVSAWGLGTVVAVGLYLWTEKDEGRPGGRIHFATLVHRTRDAVMDFTPKDGASFPESLRREVLKAVGDSLASLEMKPEELERDVPGGYTVEAEGGGWNVRVFDQYGAAWTFRFNRDGQLVMPTERR